uniref:Uncharacterized protein n=1 Tax=Equus caballus TaxID=9796 RepID=A0A3Q2HX73_HORSE
CSPAPPPLYSDAPYLGPGVLGGATCRQHHRELAAERARPNPGTAARVAAVPPSGWPSPQGSSQPAN